MLDQCRSCLLTLISNTNAKTPAFPLFLWTARPDYTCLFHQSTYGRKQSDPYCYQYQYVYRFTYRRDDRKPCFNPRRIFYIFFLGRRNFLFSTQKESYVFILQENFPIFHLRRKNYLWRAQKQRIKFPKP
jgi:hypothetical protein